MLIYPLLPLFLCPFLTLIMFFLIFLFLMAYRSLLVSHPIYTWHHDVWYTQTNDDRVLENGVETVTIVEDGKLKSKTINGVPQAITG